MTRPRAGMASGWAAGYARERRELAGTDWLVAVRRLAPIYVEEEAADDERPEDESDRRVKGEVTS